MITQILCIVHQLRDVGFVSELLYRTPLAYPLLILSLFLDVHLIFPFPCLNKFKLPYMSSYRLFLAILKMLEQHEWCIMTWHNNEIPNRRIIGLLTDVIATLNQLMWKLTLFVAETVSIWLIFHQLLCGQLKWLIALFRSVLPVQLRCWASPWQYLTAQHACTVKPNEPTSTNRWINTSVIVISMLRYSKYTVPFIYPRNKHIEAWVSFSISFYTFESNIKPWICQCNCSSCLRIFCRLVPFHLLLVKQRQRPTATCPLDAFYI